MTTEPQSSTTRASRGFEYAFSSVCLLLVIFAIACFGYSIYLTTPAVGGVCNGSCSYSYAVDWLIILLVGALFAVQMMIMAKKVTSGVEQYYYCIASVLVASIILIMTTVQTGIVIDEFVNGCADTYTGDPEGLYFDPISGEEYYYSGDEYYYSVACVFQSSFAATTTIGALVAEGLCPEAKARLQSNNALLNTALTLASSTQVAFPDTAAIIFFAPSDAALMAALPKLGVSVAQLAGNPELIKEILSLHIATAVSTADSTATNANGDIVAFKLYGVSFPISDFVASTDNAARSVVEGSVTAKTDDVIACANGSIAVFIDKVFLPGADATVVTPTPGPSVAPPFTIGGLVGAACAGIKNVLSGPNFSTLAGLLADPDISGTDINLPKGVLVIAAPTNAAFTSYIASVGPAVAANKTAVAEILANHIAVANSASDSTAAALGGENLAFWASVAGSSVPVSTSIAAIAAGKSGIITDADYNQMANVLGAVTCIAEGQYAFGIDTVLVPAEYEPSPTPVLVPQSTPPTPLSVVPSANSNSSPSIDPRTNRPIDPSTGLPIRPRTLSPASSTVWSARSTSCITSIAIALSTFVW